jgi:protein-S-isoprenylcysteine O-methyltransferase Ste14
MAPRDQGAGVRLPPPFTYLAGLALGLVADAWHPLPVLPGAAARILGGVLVAAGVLLGPVWGIATLRRAGTTVRPDRPSRQLVTAGPFRFSRNPLYLALTLLYAGVALLANAGAALLLLIPILFLMQRLVIRREEAYLARTFGTEYEAYRAAVRRWL